MRINLKMKKKIMVDTWAWLEILKGTGNGKKAKETITGNSLCTTTGNTYELRYLLSKEYGEKAEKIINGIIGNCTVIDVTDEISRKASEIKLMKGYGIGAVDCFTLAAGEILNARVLTGDPHMKDMKNVIYIG